jgi:hypothetical protein
MQVFKASQAQAPPKTYAKAQGRNFGGKNVAIRLENNLN